MLYICSLHYNDFGLMTMFCSLYNRWRLWPFAKAFIYPLDKNIFCKKNSFLFKLFSCHGPSWFCNPYEPLQISALTLVSHRWTNCCSPVWKLFWINFGTQSKLRHKAFRISKKHEVCNPIFSVRQLLVPKNYKILAFLTKMK